MDMQNYYFPFEKRAGIVKLSTGSKIKHQKENRHEILSFYRSYAYLFW